MSPFRAAEAPRKRSWVLPVVLILGGFATAAIGDVVGHRPVLQAAQRPNLLEVAGAIWLARQWWASSRRRSGPAVVAPSAEQSPERDDWATARRLAADLVEGRQLEPLGLWELVLDPEERPYLDLRAEYWRYYGVDVVAGGARGVFWGEPATYVSRYRPPPLQFRRSFDADMAESVQRWREQQDIRVVMTGDRMLCRVDREWLSFGYAAITELYPDLERWTVVMGFPDTPPVMLRGTAVPTLLVYFLNRWYGPQALLAHPALERLRRAH